MSTHGALGLVSIFGKDAKSDLYKAVVSEGYALLDELITESACAQIIKDVKSKTGCYPFDISEDHGYKGVFRSPFLFSNGLRDLALNTDLNSILKEFFPTGYQLHLSRAVFNEAQVGASTLEWHRDMPHMHTYSSSPLSLSILTFLNSYQNEVQLVIKDRSHRENFYTFLSADEIAIQVSPGTSIIFDSNLVHMTPRPKVGSIAYNLLMFSTPLIKPIVEYTSPAFFRHLLENPYRVQALLEILGHKFIRPRDDLEYMMSKVDGPSRKIS